MTYKMFVLIQEIIILPDFCLDNNITTAYFFFMFAESAFDLLFPLTCLVSFCLNVSSFF